MTVQTSFDFGRAAVFCSECGRPLSDPDSIHDGIGPICAAKHGKHQDLEDQDGHPAELTRMYDGGDLWFRRTERGLETNVPHAWVLHSPTGLEIGYGGSGPADAALNCLLLITGDRRLSERWHQDFKREFIATMSEHGGRISRGAILDWLQKRSTE